MSFYWLQHAFLMVTVVVMLTLIPDVCVSKQKITFFFYVELTIKNMSYYVRNAGLLTFLFHLIYVCSKET